MTDRDYAINAMRMWWDASPLAAIHLSTFQDALAYYDKQGTFVTAFGKSVRSIEISRVKTAMQKLAVKYETKYPPTSEFANYLAAEAGSFTLGDAKDVAAKTIADVGGLAKMGLGIWAVAIGVGIVVIMAGQSGAISSKLRKLRLS